ncbi:hypothetical protein GCM10023156_16960 [Novipirellula rosea]|uniref:Uncharacterized protein n=1 Tax=Novipirellula rosea TaxID=1031540 RepID=A0ABP8ML38_9BACT
MIQQEERETTENTRLATLFPLFAPVQIVRSIISLVWRRIVGCSGEIKIMSMIKIKNFVGRDL